MSWDVYSKLLLKECPQDFVSYFAPGARYVGMRETQFQTREDGPFDPREMRSDVVLEAQRVGLPFLIHVEWQAAKDENMDERLLGYNFEAMRLHKLSVLSCVIYLQKVSDVPQAPLKRSLPGGRPMIWFDYESLELGQQLVEHFRQLDLDGFWPLALLCEDGASYDVLEEVLARLENQKELLNLTRFFAGKVFTSDEDRKRLDRRFAMSGLREFLNDSWTFQQTLEEGREEGREQGREQGREEATRQNIEAIVHARFPALLTWAKSQLAQQTDLAKLQELLITVSTAQKAEEVEKSLLALR